jgi:dihydroorotase
MKVFPPIRTRGDRDALVDGLAKGTIKIVATDHAPHADDEKAASFDDAPAGSPGVQTLYVSCLELARRLGDVWLAPRWVAEAPSKLAGLQDAKGTIAPGYDADLVIVDPNKATRVRPEMMRSRQRHGALDGLEFGFSIKEVYLRGSPVSAARGSARAAGRLVRPARHL